jgi:hypothetical protein
MAYPKRPADIPAVLPDHYVDRRTAALFLGLSPATLATWATDGIGPRFKKFSAGRSGAVRYSMLELQRYADDPAGYSPRPVEPFLGSAARKAGRKGDAK